ncbi:MAG: hypothetical protein ACREHG_04995 [Candidatus Saccharimonadales bacterium]
MGLALDTVLASVTNQGATAGAVTFATGNSGTVRSFASPATAKLQNVFLKGAALSEVNISSPLIYNDVKAIDFKSSQGPASYTLPPDVGQMLQSQDTLSVKASSGTADSTAVAYQNYYTDLSGAAAKLYNWGDISGVIEHLHTVEIDVTASATIGAWNDTVITTTQDDLKANRWHAVLGFIVDVACLCVAFSGTDTSSLRVSGPGTIRTDDTSDWFIRQSAHHGTPQIPIFNSANKDTTYVSVADNAASTAVKVQLVTALLSSSFTG